MLPAQTGQSAAERSLPRASAPPASGGGGQWLRKLLSNLALALASVSGVDPRSAFVGLVLTSRLGARLTYDSGRCPFYTDSNRSTPLEGNGFELDDTDRFENIYLGGSPLGVVVSRFLISGQSSKPGGDKTQYRVYCHGFRTDPVVVLGWTEGNVDVLRELAIQVPNLVRLGGAVFMDSSCWFQIEVGPQGDDVSTVFLVDATQGMRA